MNAVSSPESRLICLIDREGRVTERGVNRAFERTIGCSRDGVGGQVLWERWIDPLEAEEVRARIERAVRGEMLDEHDNRWVASTGRRLTITWTCTALPEVDGRAIFLVSGIDAGRRSGRVEETGDAQERFRAVIESAPVAIVEIGVDDTVKLWNPAAERIFGWSADEILGRPPLWVPEDRLEEFRALSTREAGGEGYTGFETVRVHRSGRRLDVEISAAPIRDAGGSVVGAMAILRDITERKRQQEEVRASRARIVHAADESRRKIERDLHDGAQQRLVALSVSLGLAAAKLPSDPESASAILAEAREELARALEELRELARGIHPAVLTERGLAAAIGTLVARAPLPVGLELADDRLPRPVEAALYYVVAESLTNIVKYASATSAHIRLEVDGRSVVAAEVSDDGVGGADPARGSGLRGLADRVEALDGRLIVDSPPGGGTRVRVEVPVAAAGGPRLPSSPTRGRLAACPARGCQDPRLTEFAAHAPQAPLQLRLREAVQGSPTEAELRRLSEEGDGWARVLQGLIDDGEGRLAGYGVDPARELAEIAAELRRVDSLRRELAEVRQLLAELEERSRDLRSH